MIGSAPRVRGTPSGRANFELATRFSPARAGNSSVLIASMIAGTGSAPRVRGTHAEAVRRANVRGSAPRVRGTPNGTCEKFKPMRFSPARAGNSSTGRDI